MVMTSALVPSKEARAVANSALVRATSVTRTSLPGEDEAVSPGGNGALAAGALTAASRR